MCFLEKIFLHRPTCKTTFARLTQSQAISQSFRVFITFRPMRDTTVFIFKTLFYTKLPFPLPLSLLWSAHSLLAYSIMTKHNTPQQEFYTKIKYLNSGIREKVWFSDESNNTNSDSKVLISISACIPRNNKRKTNKQEGETTW